MIKNFLNSDISTCPIINRRWFVPEGCLENFPAAQIKQNFTRYLEGALVIDAVGLFFAGMHGSFDCTGYQLHFYCIVAGDKVKALENLRGNFWFVSSKDEIYRPFSI